MELGFLPLQKKKKKRKVLKSVGTKIFLDSSYLKTHRSTSRFSMNLYPVIEEAFEASSTAGSLLCTLWYLIRAEFMLKPFL